MSIFDIKYNDLKSLEASQLQGLLNKLIYLECYNYDIPASSVIATSSERITIKDSGADALVEIPVPNTSHFPSQKMLFQVKATDIKSLATELKKKKKLKNI